MDGAVDGGLLVRARPAGGSCRGLAEIAHLASDKSIPAHVSSAFGPQRKFVAED